VHWLRWCAVSTGGCVVPLWELGESGLLAMATETLIAAAGEAAGSRGRELHHFAHGGYVHELARRVARVRVAGSGS
jgi:hypothetical protein